MRKHFGRYIHQREEWPHFHWDHQQLFFEFTRIRGFQQRVLAQMEMLGFAVRSATNLENLTQDVLKSCEIEGEILNPEQVRSSLARRLGLEIAGLVPADRNVDGVVEMMLDATQRYDQPLTAERLFQWHRLLFPDGKSGSYNILVGQWRDDSTGPMQVVSGAMGRETVHFEAPEASRVASEMEAFLDWYNNEHSLDLVFKAAVAHFWFLTIHPFEDGNGRIARAIADSLLARADRSTQRFYSMSAQIRFKRKSYYEILERSQKGGLDITPWMFWFLSCLLGALIAAEDLLEGVLQKHFFWERNAHMDFNARQRLLLNKLMDGFDGKLNTSKWAKIAKCSQDTAARDIQDLIDKDILFKEAAGGRSTSYALVDPKDQIKRIFARLAAQAENS